MARLLKTSESGLEDFITGTMRIGHKRPCTVSPTIGFEFEIPLDTDVLAADGCFDDHDEVHDMDYWNFDPADGAASDGFGYRWLEDRGFISHFECGGFEVGSPVHANIAQARHTAAALLDVINKQKWLSPNSHTEYSDCGIHVHAGLPDPDKSGDAAALTGLAERVLNRAGSKDFLWALSGRRGGGGYSVQARSTEWDQYRGANTGDHSRYVNNRGTVRTNGRGAYSTVEYRFFEGVANRLIPSIDFAHSFTKWLMPMLEEAKGFVTPHPRYTWDMGIHHYADKEAVHRFVPHITQYKEWLMKQPGYAAMKAEPSLELI